MLGKAVARIASTLAATALFVTLSVASGHAQATTGKIQGRVVSTTGQPIASAQVSIDGTSLGNITNDDGFYFINDVPAGLHTIRAQSIGFRTTILSEQRILAGQTATLNFNLEQAAVQIDALVVAGERNPLVPRDQVSSRAIVTGETIDRLPLDNSASIITLQPGVVTTNEGFSIRGGREGEHGVYVDGVPVRNLRTGTAETLELGTNALAQVDVTTGGISARYGNSQSGVVNYVTRTGGSTLGGSLSFMTDRLAPKGIRGGFTRAEGSIGGPIPWLSNLSFFTSATVEGNKYGAQPQGNPYTIYVPSGVDTTITLARTSQTTGGIDSVDVVIPNFVPWDNGATLPTGVADEVNLTSKLSYGLGRGSRIDLTHYYNRDQSISRGTASILNPDAWGGSYGSRNMFNLGGYFLITQSADRALALDLRASYMDQWAQSGDLARDYQEGHLFPAFGFNFSSLDFVFDPDDYPVTEEMILALRSGVLPTRILSIMPGRSELTTRQGVEGVTQTLRLNPYGMRSSWTTTGIGNASQAYSQEKRWYFAGSADWQMNRFNRIWVGGELTRGDSKTMSVPLYDGLPSATHYKPVTGGLYVNNRLDIGDVVLEGGLRMDYYKPDGMFPRLPGFVTFLPDSLKGDAYVLDPGTTPWQERLRPLEDCGGAATLPDRINPVNGQAVCKNNFVPTKTRTVLNPKLAVSFPVTSTSTFRLSYGHNVQPTALTTLLNFATVDLSSTNTNATFGRDVDLPKTVLFEAGYRQVFGGNLVVDVAAYTRNTRNALTYRKIQYTNPVTGGSTFLNVLTNADYSLTRGIDLDVRRRISNVADVTLNYSFLDAKGTGSDPNTYTGLILRRNTNVSIVTGSPVDAPELLMTLDQSRAHSFAGTLALQFGDDHMEDNRVANAILGDLGVFSTFKAASGLPYTRLENVGDGQTGPPTVAGQGGTPAEDLNASRGPGLVTFDTRITKGFRVFGFGARAFADLRNPFNIANTNSIFMETGELTNDIWYDRQIQALLLNQTGTGDVRDMQIDAWYAENDVNRHMLRRAEERFGNGDGVFTVSEMTNAWGTYFNYATGGSPWRMRTSEQSLRLGLEFTF
jgi:hypothetical protein